MPVLKRNTYIVPNFQNWVDYTQTKVITSGSYWIFATRGVNMIRLNSTDLETSTNNGSTWGNTTAFANYTNLLHGYIFSNGNIALFTKDNKIYLTSTALGTITEKTLYEDDYSTPYTFHTPSNSSYPGAYLECEAHMAHSEDTDIYVLANYCNSGFLGGGGRGASPVIVPMTDDYGVTWINSYSFGQNLVYKDDGTANGSDTGTTLGDSGNSEVARHIHSIEYNSYTDTFYMNTGDHNWTYTTPDMDEIGWYTGTYSDITRTITWSRIDFSITIERTTRLKATGFFFTNTHIYWGSDANPVTVPDEQGVWRCAIADFDTPVEHEKLIPLWTDYTVLDLKIDINTNYALGILIDSDTGLSDTLLVAKNYGLGNYMIKRFTDVTNFLRINTPDSNGYFRLDADGFETEQSKTFLIKIGDDLFKNI